MKLPRIHILIGALCVLLGGCVTAPLKTVGDRERLAETTGFASGDIEFMNYCFFEELEGMDAEKELKGTRGMVVLTDNELCLMDGSLRTAPNDYFLVAPLSDIDGVSSNGNQIQLKYEDRLIVLYLHSWNDQVSDEALTQKFYETMIFANVPRMEATEYYSFTRLKSPVDMKGILDARQRGKAARAREKELVNGETGFPQ